MGWITSNQDIANSMWKMTFADQSRYNRLFQQLIQKWGKSEINYIKIFQNAKTLEISVVNSYSEDHLMYTLLENLQKGGKPSAQISSHQEELTRQEKNVDKNNLLCLTYKLIIWIQTIH